MIEHTPGPWAPAHEPHGRGYGWQAGPCWLGQKPHSAQTAADARLAAAAPVMLEALRKAVVLLAGVCVHCPELEPYEAYEAVSAAIAKATGASDDS